MEMANDVLANGPACVNVTFTFVAPDLATTNVCETSTPNDDTVPVNVSVMMPEVLLGAEPLLHAAVTTMAIAATIGDSRFRIISIGASASSWH
jgi:hypothetical protein